MSKLCECGCGEAAPIATFTDRTRGWVKGEPKRFIQYHQNRKTQSYTGPGVSAEEKYRLVEKIPLCECHGEPMSWQKLERLREGGHWQCKVMLSKSGRKSRLKKFGLTEEEYKDLFSKQRGVCAICESPPDTRWKMLAVDHCHETNQVRGLLCMVCNTMLGRFEARQERVLEYLGLELTNS